MHTRTPNGKAKAVVTKIMDHLGPQALATATAVRALQATWIPTVASELTLIPVSAVTDAHGNITKPATTCARGTKRKLLDTPVAGDGTLYKPNQVPEGVETKTLDQATTTLIGLFQWGQTPLTKRVKLLELMPDQGERMLKTEILAIGRQEEMLQLQEDAAVFNA